MKYDFRIITGLFFSFVFFAVAACNRGSAVTRYDIDKTISEYWPELLAVELNSVRLAAFDVCSLFPGSDWDKVYTVRPYTPLEDIRDLKLKNFRKIKKHFRGFEYSDFHEGLLFVKDNEIIQYSIASRRLHFSAVSSFSRTDCPVLQLERRYKSDTSHFFTLVLNAPD